MQATAAGASALREETHRRLIRARSQSCSRAWRVTDCPRTRSAIPPPAIDAVTSLPQPHTSLTSALSALCLTTTEGRLLPPRTPRRR